MFYVHIFRLQNHTLATEFADARTKKKTSCMPKLVFQLRFLKKCRNNLILRSFTITGKKAGN